MAKTVQLLAVVGGVVNETKARMAQLMHVASQPGLFEGHDRTYQPADDGGVQFPPEPKKLRVTAAGVLEMAQAVLTRNWDLALTLDTANAKAYSDVVVDGKVLLEKVPVGHLLWLDRELEALQKLVAALPELNPAQNWTVDGQADGVSRTDPPVQTLQRDKRPFNWHRENGTKEHQEQVDVLYHDDVIGHWTQVNFSGALPGKRKEELLRRVDKVRQAVKMAREDANTVTAPDQHEGEKVFGYLLAP